MIVIVVLAILAGVVVMSIGGIFETNRKRAYEVTKHELKNAVAEYASKNHGFLPNSSLFDTDVLHPETEALRCDAGNESCYVININLLLSGAEQPGILGKAPESASAANCAGCSGSYTWLMDDQGNIYSACTNDTRCESMIATDVHGNYYDDYCKPTYP